MNLRPRRCVASACAALALLAGVTLSGCSSEPSPPQVTGAPELTTSTLRIAVVDEDPDAALQARLMVIALGTRQVQAQIQQPRKGQQGPSQQGWSAADAVEALGQGQVDLVVSAAQPLASRGTVESEPPPQDAAAARKLAAASLPDDVASLPAGLGDRELSLVTNQAEDRGDDPLTLQNAAKRCDSQRLAATQPWMAERQREWERLSKCAPQRTEAVSQPADALDRVRRTQAALAVVPSTTPQIQDWGLVEVQDSSNTLGADPLVVLGRTDVVGQDSLKVLSRVAAVSADDRWLQLRRLTQGRSLADASDDLGRWLVQNGAVDGDDQGEPKTQSPTASSSN